MIVTRVLLLLHGEDRLHVTCGVCKRRETIEGGRTDRQVLRFYYKHMVLHSHDT